MGIVTEAQKQMRYEGECNSDAGHPITMPLLGERTIHIGGGMCPRCGLTMMVQSVYERLTIVQRGYYDALSADDWLKILPDGFGKTWDEPVLVHTAEA